MPRNGSGVYTLPAGNPVVPGTTIDAAWANSTLEDLGNEVTNSLSRTGAGGMQGPLRLTNGSVTAPSLAFTSETNSGLYRSGAASVWMAILGANVAQFSSTGLVVTSGKSFTAQGNATVGGTFGVTGAVSLSSTLAVTGAITATGGVLGNVTAASGTSTFNNVTINGDLDMDAGSSGTITNLPNPTNSGDAANKAYVDAQDALRLALTGGTMTGAIAMSNNKITGLGTPSADGDAATKAYVDSVAQGIDAKASCLVATTANISLSGTQTIDGVSVTAGQRVLVKDQSTASQNGIYVSAAGSWSRSSDADTWDELVAAYTFIEQGTVNANSGYICTIAAGGTLGSTAVTWAQFSGAGQITAGTGMTKTGNTLNVNTASSARIVVGADEIDLATTGVTASTYKSVTVDAYGRVTAGTNPTTLAGFGISDAYTQTQVDTFLAAKLSLSGGTMTGAIAMGTYKITGLGDPTNAQDAATKNYIDTIFGSTTSAAASAAAAASSASSASSSASSASSSASSASSSASSALSYLNTFRGQYIGAASSDPTVDGNGAALTAGDLYFNTTANEMRVYDGSAWLTAYLPATGYLALSGGTMTGAITFAAGQTISGYLTTASAASTYAALGSANTFTVNQTITANTSSDALKITQTGSGNALYIEDVAADATPFVVSATGVLGIGTTTPDNVTGAGIALVSNSGYYPQMVNRNTANDANASYMVFEKNRNGAAVQNGDILGNLIFRGYDGANYLQAAAIWSAISATPGTNDMPGDLIFGTTPDGASGITERFRISNAGAWGLSGANYGSSGNVLTSQGSGSPPVWSAPAAGGFSNMAVLTSGTSWTAPAGVTKIKVYVTGGGGGGGGVAFTSAALSAGGGGAGATAIKIFTVVAGSSYTYAIGSGGTGGASGGNAGNSGGSSTFTVGGTTVTGGGGTGGGASSSTSGTISGGSGGTATNGDMNIGGGGGGGGAPLEWDGIIPTGQGASSFWGGGGNTTGSDSTSAAGGSATAFGAGGGGATRFGNAAAAGGNGRAGVIVIEY